MIVTRFAPSPTGYLHLGGARTALFNWLMARHNNGRFLLRIEDTDRKRNTPTATGQVMEDLHWLGIDWDEGPQTGGPNGPYFQSQRVDIYDKYIKQLISNGRAYYCFETPEELQRMRKTAAAEKKNFLYRRPEHFPSEKDAENARSAGKSVTVRFIFDSSRAITVKDIVRGEVKFAPGEIGDFIIRKSDGLPTYNFACVVDDALMGVTHIIRGQEHLMNTPGQQMLWQALFDDKALPQYAHMSVTVSETGGKLSKRQRGQTLIKDVKQRQNLIDLKQLAKAGGLTTEQLDSFIKGKAMLDMPAVNAMAEFLGVSLPEINIVDFFKSGYLPEAMVNFLALLGWNPGDGREIMTAEQLIDAFDISRLAKSNSLFDRKKLIAFNTEHIRTADKQKLLQHFRKYIQAVDSPLDDADDDLLAELITINEGARTLAQIEQKCRFLFLDNEQIQYDPKAVKKVLLQNEGLAMLKIIRDKLAGMERLSEQQLEDMLRTLAEEKQVGLGRVAQPLRIAICGNTVSPPIFDSVNLLGRENALVRIDITLKKFETEKSD